MVFSKEAEKEEEEAGEQPLKTKRKKDVASDNMHQAAATAKLSEDLQNLSSEDTQKHMTKVMQVKQEAGSEAASSAHKKGMPAPTSISKPINLDSPQKLSPLPDDNQPISKTFKITLNQAYLFL